MSVKTPKAFEYPGTVDDVTYTTETTQNKYGASGKRIERLEKGITTRYYYTGDALLYSTNEKNVLETENILDPAGSVIASKRFLDPSELGTEKYANKYYVFNYDARGSVTNVIAPNGSVVKGYDYDEFGNTEQKGEEDFLNDITFTSSVADTSSNLQYMNSRFYQPSTGRFLSQDAYSGNAYDPWTQHLYVYCGNNPINFIDPTGHKIEELAKKVEVAKAYMNRHERLRDEAKANGKIGSYNYFCSAYERSHAEYMKLNSELLAANKKTPNSELVKIFQENTGYYEKLKPGQMYYIDYSRGIGIDPGFGHIGKVSGATVVFNEFKYAEYEYSGLAASLSLGVPVIDDTYHFGIVEGVYDVNDFAGDFQTTFFVPLNLGNESAEGCCINSKGGLNSRGEKVTAHSKWGYSNYGMSSGVSSTYYVSINDWQYDSYNLGWVYEASQFSK